MSPLVNAKIQEVHNRIVASEIRAGRKAGSVTLIAVSKTKTLDAVNSVAAQGIMNFGENYVQEALKKIEKMKTAQPNLKWHLVGGLQTNKSKSVVGKFETIQSVDRFELANTLNTRAQEAGVIQNILIQVKLWEEPTKGGVSAAELKTLVEKIIPLKNLKLEGLMTLPPLDVEPETSRKYFAQLRKLQEDLASFVPATSGSFKELSMGTTHDFEVAIEEGATMVRIGTAIFGPREN